MKSLKIRFNKDGYLICGITNQICFRSSGDLIHPCPNCDKAEKYFKSEKNTKQ